MPSAVFYSYPKSGRTWVRFMVDSYLCHAHNLDVPNVFEAEKALAGQFQIEWTHLTGAMIMRRQYWEMGPIDLREVAELPWVMLTRNFRATLRSAFFQARDRLPVFNGTPSQFVRSSRFGVVKLATFYNQWEGYRKGLQRAHVVAYEDVKDDPTNGLLLVLSALGISVDMSLVTQVVAESGFEQMRELGLSPAYAGTPLAPTDPNRPETFKVRQAGREKQELFSAEDLVYIDETAKAVFKHADKPEYRYLLGPEPQPAVSVAG